MLRYRLTTKFATVEVWVDTFDLNESGPIQYSVEDPTVKTWLQNQRGAFGHFIGDDTSPVDLHYVMHTPQAKQFNPQAIEGEESIISYNPRISRGAIT